MRLTSSRLPVGSYRAPIRPSPSRVVTGPVPSSRQREMTDVLWLKRDQFPPVGADGHVSYGAQLWVEHDPGR